MNSLPEQRRSQSDADFPIPETIDLSNRGPDKNPEDELMNDWQPSGHEKAIICTLALLNLVVALDAKVIVTSLTQAIIKDVSGTTTQAFWIGTSYLLVNAVSMPTISSISDVIGRPICLTVSIILFLIGTILCATSHSITVMLAGRSIQGVGGGGIHSISLITQPDFVLLWWRPKWYGMTLAAWAIGLSLGPIIGGVIAERTTWRWIFYLMFPILGLGLVAVPYLLTLKPKKATAQEKFSRIDWVGMVIFTGSLTSFLIAISWDGTQHPWNSAATIAPLVIGALGIITTVFYEAYVAKFPFLRKELFRDFSSIATYIGGGLQGLIVGPRHTGSQINSYGLTPSIYSCMGVSTTSHSTFNPSRSTLPPIQAWPGFQMLSAFQSQRS
ncbi:putative major facilitator superfamily transporter [Rosellinia necatrix]|uniref:Putative major facilitator superfamily transporter n=1 Tax=Rosellinia necatrix TaxID=77044 RepID=A0A1S8A7X1_ROSNE|nr:putative major facilitator superfamily transporter [Rosellinia necatrix]